MSTTTPRVDPEGAGRVDARHLVGERAGVAVSGPRSIGAAGCWWRRRCRCRPGRGRSGPSAVGSPTSSAASRSVVPDLRAPAADHERAAVPVGELAPVLAACVEVVARVAPLADHALETLLEGRVEQHRRRRRTPPGPATSSRRAEPVEQVAPLLERRGRSGRGRRGGAGRRPCSVAGTRLHQAGDLLGVAQVHAVLEHPEVGQAAVVERDDLAVDQQVAVAERRRG